MAKPNSKPTYKIGETDLEEYPGMRLPICLCLDVSTSMDLSGQIHELNKGVHELYAMLQKDTKTKYTAEIAIVTFGGNCEVTTVRDFSRIDIQGDLEDLDAKGLTPIGEGVNKALDMIEERKKQYRKYGNSFYRPWLIIMSDGKPEGHDPEELERAKDRIKTAINRKSVLPISVPMGIGKKDPICRDVMKDLGGGICIPLHDGKFPEFFKWLHRSVSDSINNDVEAILRQSLKNAVNWSDDGFFAK